MVDDNRSHDRFTDRREAIYNEASLAGDSVQNYLKRGLLRSSRRRFLKQMSKLGMSGATLQYLTKDALAESVDNPDKEVPRLKGFEYEQKVADPSKRDGPPEREPVYYSIPKSEWVKRACTRAAADRLGRNTDEIHIGFGLTNINGDLAILAQHSTFKRKDGSSDSPPITFEEMKDRLPDRTHGIVERDRDEYRVEDISIIYQKAVYSPQAFDDKYGPVPGGCASSDCTLGFPAYDNDTDDYCHTTAAHCVDRDYGEDVYQPDYQRHLGACNGYTTSGNGDVAKTNIDSDDAVIIDIADQADGGQNSEGWLIAGTYYSDKLDDMVANNESAYKQGSTTGRQKGEVLAHFDQNAATGPKVRIDADRAGGDSGGPYFNLEYGTNITYSYRIGIHAWGSGPNLNDSAGNTFYYAENELNIS